MFLRMHNTDTHTGPSFSLKNRLARLVWIIAYILFFRYSPRPFHIWRSFILKLFGAKIEQRVHVYPKVKIWAPWNLELKKECGIGNDATLYSQGKITIGERSVISQGVHICTGTHDYTLSGFPLFTHPITIGDQVWIAAEAFIGPGVTVGDGAVVAARAVVVKDVDSWTVVGGNPAKFIKKREILN